MKIYLIRHGETTGDLEDRYGGDYDDHLTPYGEEEALELSEKLKDAKIGKIFVSSLIRAQETAKILDSKLKVGLETLPELRERNLYGILTGLTKKESLEKYPKEVEMLKNTENTLPDGETAKHFVERVLGAFWKISEEKFKTVAIITHGGVIRRIYSLILKIPKELKVDDCSFAEIEVNGSEVKLIKEDGISFK